MTKLDRLSALLEHFRLHASEAPLGHANLAAFGEPGGPAEQLVFSPREDGIEPQGRETSFALRIDFGTLSNPLRAALPDRMTEAVTPGSDLSSIVSLLSSEHQARRCGAPAVLSRLGEVLVVRMLRLQMDRGVTTPGLLAGLANPRISYALVAMHTDPGRFWQNADLAEAAGLSHSRFKELFRQVVGQSPASYLRGWRMLLAKADLERGERIDRVSHRYGYRAPDAFSRAFLKEFGARPKSAASKAMNSGQ